MQRICNLSALLVLLGVGDAVMPRGVPAQVRDAEIRGRVIRANDTATAIVQVEVELVPSGARVRSDEQGYFRIQGVAPGTYELRARLIGFAPAARRVVVSDHAAITKADIAMDQNPQSLTVINVEGKEMSVPSRFAAAYERKSKGWGKFFTRHDIEERNPSDLKALLATLPAVHVNDRGLTFERCQADLNHLSAALSGGSGSERLGAPRRPGNVQVYVDGHRLTWTTVDPTAEADADRILKRIHPSSVEVMEVYTGVTRIPPEFMSDACAVIVIWTKAY